MHFLQPMATQEMYKAGFIVYSQLFTTHSRNLNIVLKYCRENLKRIFQDFRQSKQFLGIYLTTMAKQFPLKSLLDHLRALHSLMLVASV